LQSRGHIDPITQDIAVLLNDVTQMNADADVNLFALIFLGVVSAKLRLDTLGTLHSVNDRGEVHQEAITHSLDDCPMIVSDRLLDDLIVDSEHPQRAGFIGAHLAAEAHEVGEHDGGQLTGLGRCLCRVLCHGGDYPSSVRWLSNGGQSRLSADICILGHPLACYL